MPIERVVERACWLGLDIGQVNDPAALAVLERVRTFTPGPHDPRDPVGGRWTQRYGIRFLERLKLGTAYPAIVDRVAAVCHSLAAVEPEVGRLIEIVVDVTGVGRPVFDMLRDRALGMRIVGVHYTAGQRPSLSPDGSIWNVPKRDLVSNLVLLFQNRELAIAEKLPDAQVLINELVNFQQTISQAGHDSYANDGKLAKKDDYVNASALAAWRARLREPRELGVGSPLLML